jgi:hypothetical protein
MNKIPKELKRELEELQEVEHLLNSPEYQVRESFGDHAVEGTRENLLELQKKLKIKIKDFCKHQGLDFDKVMDHFQKHQ